MDTRPDHTGAPLPGVATCLLQPVLRVSLFRGDQF